MPAVAQHHAERDARTGLDHGVAALERLARAFAQRRMHVGAGAEDEGRHLQAHGGLREQRAVGRAPREVAGIDRSRYGRDRVAADQVHDRGGVERLQLAAHRLQALRLAPRLQREVERRARLAAARERDRAGRSLGDRRLVGERLGGRNGM